MPGPVREATQSLWMDAARVRPRQPLKEDVRADVCVIGAGIAGLSTAYLLASEGKRVVVLDDGPVGGGQTERTSAHLSSAIDDRFAEVEKARGLEGSRLAAESHAAAIDRIEAISTDEGIDCDFRRVDGYLFLAPGQSPDLLQRELEAARRAGLHDVGFVPRAPFPAFDTGECLRFPRQAQFHPMKYLDGLAEAFLRKGGSIHADTKASKVNGGTVKTEAGPVVTAQAVVVATNTPFNDLLAIHTKQAPYLTYALGVAVPKGSVEQALYWDALESYHYVRLQPEERDDVLIVGGEDHKSGQADDQAERWDRLEQWTRERFPMAGDVVNRWSGMVMETTDGLAFIGRNPMDKPNVYIATGDSGMGLTHGTIAGVLLTDLILGRENPWAELYDPSRKPVWGMAWREFLSENANVAKEYVKDWFGGGDYASPEEVPLGEGGLVRQGLKKVAVHRDALGVVHELSPICPHLGCVVHWNGAEKTWDCPCHGSRFSPEGEVIVGPANSPLAKE